MPTIPAIAQAMLGTDAVAHVWTNNADGSPQVSVVWVIAHGDEILFGTDANRAKAKTFVATAASFCRSKTSSGTNGATNATWSFAGAPHSNPAPTPS